jgi:chorismate synthase
MNSFGRIFKITIFGESHGKMVGVNIDGCPAGIKFSEKDLEHDLLRRKSGTIGTTPRIEDDNPQIVSGIFNGFTTGASVTILFENSNILPKDYFELKNIPRPGHADFSAMKKFNGFNDFTGGGSFSGRLTIGLVAAGVLAKKVIAPLEIYSNLVEVGGSNDIGKKIDEIINKKDSVGGIIECLVKNIPVGLGEPFFDSVESNISHIVFSIPGVKGIEFGSGFNSAKMLGSEHNDLIISVEGKTLTNNSGGINGGITNGNELFFRVAIKPTSSISLSQKTINIETGKMVDLQIKGRHDVCFALRVPVIIEAVTAIVLADFKLIQQLYSKV